MIFSYWTEDTHDNESFASSDKNDARHEWNKHFPEYTVFSDDDVLPLLACFGTDSCDLFRRIRIPACKSDIARLVLLYEYGGLYLDAHVGLQNCCRLCSIIVQLAQFECIFFRAEEDDWLMNTVLCARRNSELIKSLLTRAINNLKVHFWRERGTQQYIEYDIYNLTGVPLIISETCDMMTLQIKPEYKNIIKIETIDRHSLSSALVLYKHMGYRKPGRHWYERQKTERLFAT